MDTKWKNMTNGKNIKKIRVTIGIILFITGLTVFLYGGITRINYAHSNGYYKTWTDSEKGDYQATEEFKAFIEDRLSIFLSMSVGQGVNGAYDPIWVGDIAQESSNYISEDTEFSEDWARSEEVAQSYDQNIDWYKELHIEPNNEWNNEWNLDYYGEINDLNSFLEEHPQEREQILENFAKQTKAFLAKYECDKNLLFRIENTKLGYSFTNMDATEAITTIDGTLPKGYNFALEYSNGKVRMLKDGKEVKVYESDIYHQGDWTVPGYRNFTVNDDMLQSKIILLCAKHPCEYIIAGSKNTRYQYGYSPYSVYLNAKEESRLVEKNTGILIIGAILFVSSFLIKGKNKTFSKRIGNFLGHTWVEIRIPLLVAVLVASRYIVLAWFYPYKVEGERFYWYIIEELPNRLNLSFRELVSVISVFAVLTVYFLICDICVNRKNYFNGLIRKLINKRLEKEVNLSYSKKNIRMIRRFSMILLLGILFLIGGFYLASVKKYFSINSLLLFMLGIGVVIADLSIYVTRMSQRTKDVDSLCTKIGEIHDGKSGSEGGECQDESLNTISTKLDEIENGIEVAIEERLKSERMKTELITNVSHDIKTPLTSVISYIDLLKEEEDLPDYVKDYIQILDEKSKRLKDMVQDVFSVSKAASGQLPVELKEINYGKLLLQILADMDEKIQASNLKFKVTIPEEDIMIMADGDRLYRVFQNLIQNALLYSLNESRVHISLTKEGEFAIANVTNTSKNELDATTDFTERFVRGDKSRSDGGSGLGLSIAKSFTEACGGTLKIETCADLFIVKVSFQVTQ